MSAANDIFGAETKESLNENVGTTDDLFSNNFENDDLFGNNTNELNVDKNENKSDEDIFGAEVGFDFDATTNGDDGALFDDEFDDEQAIEFPEFDVNESKPKKDKIIKTKKKEEKLKVIEANELESSPQPNQITDIPEPVISFNAPFDDDNNNDNNNNNEDNDNDDNPFGSDLFGGDDDDDGDYDDGDNPFAFDEPEISAKNTEVDEFDPFG